MIVRVRIGDETLQLTWDEWEERVRAGRIPPYVLVQFEPVTGDQWQEAGQLEMYTSLEYEATLAWRGRFTVSPPPLLTALLVGTQIRIWWATHVPEAQGWLVWNLTNWAPPILEDGESWRLLTHGFLQTGLGHLGMNMLFLAYTGWNLERALGRANLALLYVASVLGGGLLSMFATPATPSLGASGGVFGLMAASVVFGFQRPGLLPPRSWRLFGVAMFPYVAIMLLSGFYSEGTDNWSHLGGVVTGGLLVLFLDPDILQRRPGHNRLIQGIVATAMALVLVVLGTLGPRLVPLVDSEQAQLDLLGDLGRGATPSPLLRRVGYSVPTGWQRGTTSARDMAWVSPVSLVPFADEAGRAFSVQEIERTRPLRAEALASEWATDLRRAWPEAQVDPPARTTRWDEPTLRTVARVEADVPRVLTHWVATRGTTALQVTWEVEEPLADRLEPLRDRLLSRVTWPEPVDLVHARAQVQRNPGSVRNRTELALELACAGEPEQSLALWEELVQEQPGREELWLGLLQTSTWYPQLVEDPESLWRRTLASRTTPPVVVALVEDMESHDQPELARGLLELAWIHSPGDRTLAAARSGRSLSTALDEAAAWIWTHDLATGERREEPLPARPDLELHQAARWDAEQEEARQALALEVSQALRSGEEVDPDLLLRLRERGAPRDRLWASRELARDLRAHLEGEALPWLPPEVSLRGELVDSLASGALTPCEEGPGWCSAPPPG